MATSTDHAEAGEPAPDYGAIAGVDQERLGRKLERLMQLLELVAAGVLVVMFAVGVIDFGIRLTGLAVSGRITNPRAVVGLIDTALLLFIIVEVFLTVIAYSRDSPVARTVVTAGLIAVARKIITFRTSAYGTVDAALLAAVAYGGLLAVLTAAFFVVCRSEPAADDTLV